MKKLVLALVASFILGSFAVQSLNAQTKRGSFFLTGGSQFSFQTTFTEGNEEFILSLSPSFGGFITNDLALGLSGGVFYLSSSSSVVYSAMPTMTFFFNQGKGFIPYIEIQVGYVGISSHGSSANGLGVGAGIGGIQMLNEHVGITLGFQYLHSRYFSDMRSAKSNAISTAIGLTTFF